MVWSIRDLHDLPEGIGRRGDSTQQQHSREALAHLAYAFVPESDSRDRDHREIQRAPDVPAFDQDKAGRAQGQHQSEREHRAHQPLAVVGRGTHCRGTSRHGTLSIRSPRGLSVSAALIGLSGVARGSPHPDAARGARFLWTQAEKGAETARLADGGR
jgi:hypothetical protein